MERKWMIAIPILAALLLLCAAIVVVGTVAFRQLGRADGLQFLGFSSDNVSAERDDELAFDVGAPAQLVVENPCGSVSVRAGSEGSIRVKAHVTAWGKNEADAHKELELVALDGTQDGDSLHLGLQNPDTVCDRPNRRTPTVEMVIEAPAQTAAQLHSTFGNVSLDGLEGDAELKSNFGEISARNLTGALTAASNNGAITASGIHAGVASIDLNSQFGHVRLEDAQGGSLSIIGSNGGADIRQTAITGKATVTSDFGQVTWDGGQAKSLTIESKNGSLTADSLEVAESVQITSDFGGVNLTDVKAHSYNVSTKNGVIEIDGATGNVTAHSDFGDVTVRSDADLTVDLSSENGAVTYEGGLGPGENKLRSHFGNVRVLLPKEAAFAFDLQTNFGKITSAFPITIQGAPDENHWQGTVGQGGEAQLAATTENGNISLESR